MQSTYTENGVDEGIVATVAHGEPMANEEEEMDVFVAVIVIQVQQCICVKSKNL